MPVIVAAGSFIAVFFLAFALLYLVFCRRQKVAWRLDRVLAWGVVPDENAPAAQTPPEKGLLVGLARFLPGTKLARGLELELQKADIPLKGAEFLTLNILTFLLPLIGISFLKGGFSALALAGGLFGALLPRLYLLQRQRGRLARFNTQIADALVLTANSLRAGYSFLQSMEITAREMQPPISSEFARALKEMNLGMPTEEALEATAKRVGSDDLDLVVTAVIIQRQVGGNLARILENIAETIRERVRIKGEIKTLTAQGRISGVIITLLPLGIGLFIFTINPGYLKALFTHPLGKLMLGLGLVGQLLGMLIIRKIVNIEV
ncbi:MAG: type II secretion system F family protein [Limnochordia bacterium]|jgi:tight adherence protein B